MAESASSLTCISLSISHREINILYQNNQQSSLQNFIPTKDTTSPQDIIPDLLFQSFLATTGIIWPLHLSPEPTRKKKKNKISQEIVESSFVPLPAGTISPMALHDKRSAALNCIADVISLEMLC